MATLPRSPRHAETPAVPNTVPDDVIAHVLETGRIIDTKNAIRLYRHKHALHVPGIAKHENVSYGPHARHVLNIFTTEPAPEERRPVILFVHGGGFTSGDISVPGYFLYDYLGHYFVQQGFVVVNVEYRLAPEHPWPAGGEDLAAAIQWVRGNIAPFGGDPEQLFLFGHSAGAAHVAHYAFDRRIQPADGHDGVIGVILLSGLYTQAAVEARPAYYGDNPSEDRAAVTHVPGSRRTPVFVSFAEYDPAVFHSEALALVAALIERDGTAPAGKQVSLHNHMTSIYHIGTSDDSFASDMLAFIKSVRANRAKAVSN